MSNVININAAGLVELHPAPFSEDDLALAFATLHADDLRFVGTWGKWMHWTGQRWVPDETYNAYDLIRAVCREAASECDEPHVAKKIASNQTVASVHTLARSDRRLAAVSEMWDANGWLLNTPGGVVDLRCGKLLAHSPDYYATKITAVAPGGDCPLWLSFLARVTNDDQELIAFLQRATGYALTGDTTVLRLRDRR
jgi:putative DNA primase/helicase